MIIQIVRDNFTIPTWLMMGALIQGLLCLLPYRNSALVAPVVLVLTYQIVRTVLISFGVLHNPYMDGVIDGRTVPVFATEKGTREKPADQGVCAIMLAVRSNSPLGMFAPGFKEVGDYFQTMSAELDKQATALGYMGQSQWLSAGDRGVSSEYMSMVYFESSEKLHEYAHGPLHTDAMEWWQRTAKQHKHIAIMHEVFAAPKNSWEGVYINYHPTGLGAARKEATVDGKQVWINPLVKGNGRLTYSKGRMGKPFGNGEWNAFEKTLEEDEKEGLPLNN